MARIKSIAEIVYRRINPNGGDEVGNYLGEFIATAKLQYATLLWKLNREDKYRDGVNEVPSEILQTAELEVIKNEADITHLKPLRNFGGNIWLQNVGQFDCGGCKYTVMSNREYNLLCNDPSRNENDKAVVPIGNKLIFKDGLHRKDETVNIIYAGNGSNFEDDLEIQEAVGGMLLEELLKFYGQKAPEDKSNNSNPNN